MPLASTDPVVTFHTVCCPWVCTVDVLERVPCLLHVLGFYHPAVKLSSRWKTGSIFDDGSKGVRGPCPCRSLPGWWDGFYILPPSLLASLLASLLLSLLHLFTIPIPLFLPSLSLPTGFLSHTCGRLSSDYCRLQTCKSYCVYHLHPPSLGCKHCCGQRAGSWRHQL